MVIHKGGDKRMLVLPHIITEIFIVSPLGQFAGETRFAMINPLLISDEETTSYIHQVLSYRQTVLSYRDQNWVLPYTGEQRPYQMGVKWGPQWGQSVRLWFSEIAILHIFSPHLSELVTIMAFVPMFTLGIAPGHGMYFSSC